MPSLHVGWAVLVAVAAVAVGTSRWRWLVVAHPVLTVVAVVATANHWWLDGVVAVMVMGIAYLVVRLLEAAWTRLRAAWRRSARVDDAGDSPAPVQVPELEPS
jgi:hypothetical protein